jgi:hypothetical protein
LFDQSTYGSKVPTIPPIEEVRFQEVEVNHARVESLASTPTPDEVPTDRLLDAEDRSVKRIGKDRKVATGHILLECSAIGFNGTLKILRRGPGSIEVLERMASELVSVPQKSSEVVSRCDRSGNTATSEQL